MDVLTLQTCWAVNYEIIKQVTSSWSIVIQLSRWCTYESPPRLDIRWNRLILSPVARVATNTKVHTFLFIVDDILQTAMQVALESSDPPLDAHSQRSHKTYWANKQSTPLVFLKVSRLRAEISLVAVAFLLEMHRYWAWESVTSLRFAFSSSRTNWDAGRGRYGNWLPLT